MENYSSVRRSIAGRPLYIHSQKMGELLALLELRGASTGHKALASSRAARPQYAGDRGGIAVIPIQGVISHRGSILSWLFGGTSTSDVSAALRQVVADPNISAIVLDVDSPGGDVDGVDELASEIYQARKAKPITAVSNCLCASAAYYLASQASEIIASPSSLTGSVGVYTLHEDLSGMLDNAGIKMTMVKYGENKGEGNPYEALSGDALDHMQDLVNRFGRTFEAAVARGRGIKQADVHDKFGQGRVFDAKTAVALGMADRVGTLNSALSTLSTSSGRRQAQLAVTHRIAGTSSAATPAQARETEFFRMRHELLIAAAGGSLTAPGGTKKKKTKRVDADVDPDGECGCDCGPCDDGDCEGCSCEDCACEGCACETAMKARKTKAEHARMRHQLAVAGV